ncbi:MAG TPA: hypothetical protein VNK04_12215, partial [Gemmataceae bacterium]|nr:hypothetical protein [Gemmataceae bacterium]
PHPGPQWAAEPQAASPAPADPPPAPATNGPPGANAPTNAEIHAWLSQRIAAIQQERETRWQKIVNFVLGK